MSTLEIIVEELKTLPPTKLAEAAALIHDLRETSRAERLAALERAIEEGCAKIDARDW